MNSDNVPVQVSDRAGYAVPRQRQPPSAFTRCSCATSAQQLLVELVTEPLGRLSPSVYETGRLVTLAPWLVGHAARIAFLLDSRRPDGGWGGPDGYLLVPTLSAVEALLTTLRRDQAGPVTAEMVNRGLVLLFDLLGTATGDDIPDTPAIEIIVPSLIALVNDHLDRLDTSPVAGLERWVGARLPLPSGMDDALLRTIRSILSAGSDVPTKLLHSLEVAGGAATGARGVRPLPLGMVGASPAATAAWLGDPCVVEPDHHAVRYLETVARRHGGPVPSVVPVTAFERSWVVGGLAAAGLHLDVPGELVASLRASLGPKGTPGGPGLPPDADTTSGTLHALAALGFPRTPDCLLRYETDTHFRTWAGERTPSATTNAHVLEAFTDWHVVGAGSTWHLDAAAKTSRWLCDEQRQDGSWLDKWHASAYYATACCALALARVGGDGPRRAVRRAVDWVVASQRADGSWGRWTGTTEETAYAIQILLLTGPAGDPDAVDRAAARGYLWLDAAMSRPTVRPPLWHDKDLYLPNTIVDATALAASHLVHRAPKVMAQATRS
jgi:halimadienyl-diphosphate synthase